MKTILLTFAFFVCPYTNFAQKTQPQFDLDHIIIWTQKGAPELGLFEEKGFSIADHKMVHTGIGTGGRYIYFFNMQIELLYADEKATFDSKFDKTLLAPRDKWQQTGECPFGLGLSMAPYDTAHIPFKTKEVKQPWMNPNTSLFFATSNSTYSYEPQVLIVHPIEEWIKANTIEDVIADIEKTIPATRPERRKQVQKMFTHANGVQKLTGVKFTCKAKEFSSTMQALQHIEYCQIVKSKEPLMEMTFDENRQKKKIDFRPQLPVVIYY